MTPNELENKVTEWWGLISNGFPFYGLSPFWIIVAVVVVVSCLVSYSIAGKGRGSHAGREEVRRAYRRELARQMARQDADKIKSGEKQRRKWMQW
jgi:hypothetical protein